MGGMKNTGQVITGEAERGNYKPQDSKINFAVPDARTLRTFNNLDFPTNISPGIIHSAIDLKSKEKEKDFVLSVDAKKVARGLSDDAGDVDLFGHEPGPARGQQMARLSREKHLGEQIADLLGELPPDKVLYEMPAEEKLDLHDKLKKAVTILGKRLKELRKRKLHDERSLENLLNKGGSDLTKNPYQNGIAHIKVRLDHINDSIAHCLSSVKMITLCGSSMMNSPGFAPDVVNPDLQENWIRLKKPCRLPEELRKDFRYVQQRSEEWLQERRKYTLCQDPLYMVRLD